MRYRFGRFMLALPLALMAPVAADATTLKIYPVLIQLDQTNPVQTMTIENSSDASARMQVRVVAWHQENGVDVFEDTRDVLANPPLFEVAAGAQQIARFGLRTAPGATEKSYRVFLEEIPNDRPSAPGEVRTLLRVSIPIFVPVPNAEPQLVWQVSPVSDKQVAVSVRNDGAAHIHLNQLDINRSGDAAIGSSKESIYLLPGATRKIVLDVKNPIRAGETLTLNATSDQQRLSTNLVSQTGPHVDGLR